MSRGVTTKLLVDLSAPLADQLERVCDETGGTKGGIVRVALEIYLRQLATEENEQFVVRLSSGASETLGAYRETADYPDRSKMTETALLDYINQKCETDATLRSRIEDAKRMRLRKRIQLFEPREESEGRW